MALNVLEEEHVRVQFNSIPHLVNHWKMLKLAWEYKVWDEVLGQIPRLILAIPGSLTGRAPKGNVGSTKMGIFEVKK